MPEARINAELLALFVCYSHSHPKTATETILYGWFRSGYRNCLDYPRITAYHNSCCHCVVTKVGWRRTNLCRYYSAVLFELQYRFSKFTRNILKKRAKHIDFLGAWAL